MSPAWPGLACPGLAWHDWAAATPAAGRGLALPGARGLPSCLAEDAAARWLPCLIPFGCLLRLPADAKYVHYCDNETIQGVEFKVRPRQAGWVDGGSALLWLPTTSGDPAL